MKKILFSLVAFAFMLLPLNLVNAQVDELESAVEEGMELLEDLETTVEEDMDTEVVYEVEDLDELYEELDSMWEGAEWSYATDGAAEAGILAGVLGAGLALIVLGGSLLFALAGYIYMAITMSKTAKHIGHDNPWFAWVPILNIVQIFQMGDMNPLFILLVFIPGIGALVVGIMAIISIMNICEKRGYEKALGLLTLIPVANLVLLGILAWGKKEAKKEEK